LGEATSVVRGSSVEFAMRTVVTVLLDPASDAQLGLVEVLVLVESHLLFSQAAKEPFDQIRTVEDWLRSIPRANGTKSKIRNTMSALYSRAIR
jgi:hypothetical protein